MNYLPIMITVLEVLDNALSLPLTEQSFLVKTLLEKMDDDSGEISDNYRSELKKRIARRGSGETQPLTSEEVHANIRQRIDSHSAQ